LNRRRPSGPGSPGGLPRARPFDRPDFSPASWALPFQSVEDPRAARLFARGALSSLRTRAQDLSIRELTFQSSASKVSAFVRYSACVATAEAVVRRSGLFLALRGLYLPREVPESGGAFKESISRRLGRILPEMVVGDTALYLHIVGGRFERGDRDILRLFRGRGGWALRI
jgi:hypothetical protein